MRAARALAWILAIVTIVAGHAVQRGVAGQAGSGQVSRPAEA